MKSCRSVEVFDDFKVSVCYALLALLVEVFDLCEVLPLGNQPAETQADVSFFS